MRVLDREMVMGPGHPVEGQDADSGDGTSDQEQARNEAPGGVFQKSRALASGFKQEVGDPGL